MDNAVSSSCRDHRTCRDSHPWEREKKRNQAVAATDVQGTDSS